MFIEEILKLNLKPDEAEILKKCEALLEEILRSLSDGCLGMSNLKISLLLLMFCCD